MQATIGGLALVLWLLIFARLLLSWVDPTGRNPVAGFLIQMTELAARARPADAPQAGMIDFSGLLVLLVLGAADARPALRCPESDRRPLRRPPDAAGGADHVEGVIDGVLRARVAAPGRSRERRTRRCSGCSPTSSDIPRRDVRLVAGAASRTKLVVVDGVDAGGDPRAAGPGLKL